MIISPESLNICPYGHSVDTVTSDTKLDLNPIMTSGEHLPGCTVRTEAVPSGLPFGPIAVRTERWLGATSAPTTRWQTALVVGSGLQRETQRAPIRVNGGSWSGHYEQRLGDIYLSLQLKPPFGTYTGIAAGHFRPALGRRITTTLLRGGTGGRGRYRAGYYGRGHYGLAGGIHLANGHIERC